MTVSSFIQAYCTEMERKSGYQLYKGFTLEDLWWVGADVPPGFSEKTEWADGARRVWISERERAIITYCERDIYVSVHPTAAGFEQHIHQMATFYTT